MELQADTVASLDDLLRRRVPVQRRAGRVGEERHALIRPLLSRDRGCCERAAEPDRTEECQTATHGVDSKWSHGRW
jgi:hypothetical protein